jgi:hypothetical protein
MHSGSCLGQMDAEFLLGMWGFCLDSWISSFLLRKTANKGRLRLVFFGVM